jgi:hypothetical protein
METKQTWVKPQLTEYTNSIVQGTALQASKTEGTFYRS